MNLYIYQNPDWPAFFWEDSQILRQLGEVRHLQGKLLGKMESLGFELQNEALLNTLTMDVLKSTEIEGEFLNPGQVRSSLARRLGLEIAGTVPSDRNVDGMVDMMLDATQNNSQILDEERLFGWHSALFPSGRSGLYKIQVGTWREDTTGPMQVVSGAIGREKVHYQAPDSEKVPFEMERFIEWFNSDSKIDEVIKSAVAHLWFVTIHPFNDGNGRVTRALTDMLLARADKSKQRFYSMSAQIRLERKSYYDILEKTQKGDLNITDWLLWFLDCLIKALKSTETVLVRVLTKADFWQKQKDTDLNVRQKLMLNKLLDGFEGKLTSSKWAKITNTSTDTALRDIQDLQNKNILKKDEAGGRSTNYELIF
ncbi:MAG: Fic family protein [Cytophagaceae bacterium]|nr:Fic family protein [Cytophagaceae bacterium]MBL0301194.1 Fic family protein [Cytophagaceae bacterium]MBL0324011.1 Fic family protein [Cytophagaceae bacterium]